MTLAPIRPQDLFPLDRFAGRFPLRCDMVYGDAEHPENIFGRLYRPGARIWVHKDLAAVLLLAARLCFNRSGHRMVVKDGLRTVEAQQAMNDSPAVRAHPHWTAGPGLLVSPPGTGAHPRAMAADVVLEDRDGQPVPMGTAFDHLCEDPRCNPAARAYRDLPGPCLANRRLLEDSMVEAAARLAVPLLPLPAEWWDFRAPPSVYENYAPLSDSDLPLGMRMTDRALPGAPALPDLPESHFAALEHSLLARIA